MNAVSDRSNALGEKLNKNLKFKQNLIVKKYP